MSESVWKTHDGGVRETLLEGAFVGMQWEGRTREDASGGDGEKNGKEGIRKLERNIFVETQLKTKQKTYRQILWRSDLEEHLGSLRGALTQATGPPRSDAGVGLGMLRGISLLSAN